jgi:hypothetical protein
MFSTLSARFSEKAERLYDADPNENGLLAQPYADIADCCLEASTAFDDPDEVAMLDDAPEAVATVSSVVAASAPVKNPWGNR